MTYNHICRMRDLQDHLSMVNCYIYVLHSKNSLLLHQLRLKQYYNLVGFFERVLEARRNTGRSEIGEIYI